MIKLVNNFKLDKTKTKWEIIGKLIELYLKTGNQLRVDSTIHELNTMGIKASSNTPWKRYRTEILELTKLLVNSPS